MRTCLSVRIPSRWSPSTVPTTWTPLRRNRVGPWFDPGSELIGNPGFEVDTSGWMGDVSSNTLTRVAGGHSGGWAVEVSNTVAGDSCGLDDSPNWVSFTEDGSYTASIWARSDTPGVTLTLRVREYVDGSRQGTVTETLALTSSWQQVTANYTPVAPGSSFDFEAYTSNAPAGVCFQADDASITLDVGPPSGNQAPTVNAGPDQFVSFPDSAFLDGTVTDDGLPDPPGAVSVSWSQVAGPGTVTFVDANVVDTTASFSVAGIYILRLTADDGEFQTSDDVTVVVTGDNGTEVVDVRIAASSDDAEEKVTGGMRMTSTDLDLVYDKGDQTVGMRFNGVDIPREATVLNAYVQFRTDQTNSELTSLTIKGEAVDNAVTFSDIKYNISSRPTTLTGVSWSPDPWLIVGEAGVAQQTPDISSIIQEIVNRPGWTIGNSLAIIITGTGLRTAEAIEGDAAGAPLLHVEYITGSPNNPPVANDDTASTTEDTLVTKDVSENDYDPDGNLDPTSANTDCRSCTIPSNGTLFNNGDGSFDYTPNADFNGTDGFIYEICDTESACDTANVIVTVTVTGVNNAPQFTSVPVTAATEGSLYTYIITTSDPDVGDTRTISATTRPAWLTTLVDNGNGTATLSGTPASGDVGDHPVVLQVTDAGGLFSTQTYTVTVTGVNNAPQFTSVPVTAATEGAIYTYIITTSDPDVGDTRTISVTIRPAWLPLVDNGNGTATLSGTPTSGDVGDHPVVLQVTDAGGLFSTQPFTVTVTPVSIGTPVAMNDAFTLDENTVLNGNVLDNNGNGADILGDPPNTVNLVTNVSNGLLTLNVDGTFTYTPDADFNGTDSFTYKITDGDPVPETSNTAQVSITVTAVGSYNLMVSSFADRSGAMSLNGKTVLGDIYVFTSPDAGVKRVNFYLDGVFHRSEGIAPYDFDGTGADGIALPTDTTRLSDGAHQITAVIELTAGGTEPPIIAVFTVNNGGPPVDTDGDGVPDGQDLCPGTPSGASVDANGCSAAQRDKDSDGYEGSLGTGEDCNDSNPNINPGATEVCDGVDNNCNGLIDEGCASQYSLLMSTSPNRTGAVSLDGQSVSGNIYVFTGPDAGVKRVSFYLDGVFHRLEGYAPYDFDGTGAGGIALPTDTTRLSNGEHQIKAVIELTTGVTEPPIIATFIVNNG